MRNRVATSLLVFLALLPAWARAAEASRYLCEAVYQPARSVWVRSVTLVYDDKKIIEVQIDAVPVYSFNVHGTRVLTSQDNERIAFDAAQLSWESDWRGLMQSSGRCEKAPG